MKKEEPKIPALSGITVGAVLAIIICAVTSVVMLMSNRLEPKKSEVSQPQVVVGSPKVISPILTTSVVAKPDGIIRDKGASFTILSSSSNRPAVVPESEVIRFREETKQKKISSLEK